MQLEEKPSKRMESGSRRGAQETRTERFLGVSPSAMVMDNRIADESAGPVAECTVMAPQGFGVDSGAPMRVEVGQSGDTENLRPS